MAMADEPRVQQLLDEIFASDCTPEEVCGNYPELLPEVRRRWRQMRLLDADLSALFPTRREMPDTGPTTSWDPGAGLPEVPGYEVEAVLGRGGMGVVYRARHLALKRIVALKMMACCHAQPVDRARFKAEAEAVARLQHPNIVQIHEIGETASGPFFALEFVEGGSLAKRLAGRPLPPRDAAQLVGALAEAMHLAHSRNLVHRDLKPANILLASGGCEPPEGRHNSPGGLHPPLAGLIPKITDFGLVRQLDADSGHTQVGVVMGTPSYMAPEQAQGRAHAAGPPADVYALGAILYECLTGRPPFKGETLLQTLEHVRDREPTAPSSINRQTPRDLETICLKCLRKQPERRYSSARELADDLGRFVCGEPVAARPVGVAERWWKWARRHPGVAALLVAVLLLTAAGGVGGWLLYQQRADAHARQAQTDQEVRAIVERARGVLQEGWRAADLARLTEAWGEGKRGMDIARSGGASAAVRQQAEAIQKESASRLDRVKKGRALLGAVLDVSASQDIGDSSGNRTGRSLVLAQPRVDDQFAAAFLRWGLDVDRATESEFVERLREKPDVVVQELLAGLDAWMMERRRQKRPEADWRRLFRVAEQLDHDDRHRRLRALLVGDSPPRAETVAGLVGVGSPWPVVWRMARGHDWRELLELRKDIDFKKAPVLTVLLLARACAEMGDGAGAEEMLRQASTARPDQVVLLIALGKLLERQKLEEAIGYYRAARSQRRGLGIGLSNALVRAGRARQGEEVLRDLALQQPDNPAIHFYLGVNLLIQRNHRQAETAYRRAIELNPRFPEALSNLGSALNEQRKYGEAEAASRKAIDLQPLLAQAHTNLGVALSGQQRHRQAEAAFRKAVDLEPNHPEAYSNLGIALHDQRKYGEAEAAYRKAISLKPDLALARTNLGNTLFRQGRFGEAEAAHRKAIDVAPDFPNAHTNLGNALLAQFRYAEAEAAHRKAVGLKPEFAIAHQNLGNVLFLQRKYGEAEAAFRKAIDLVPDYPDAHLGLGATLMQQAQFQAATKLLKRASDLLPVGSRNRDEARRRLQQCQRFVILDARLPAVLRGTEKPANAGEQLEFARLCLFKKCYTATARFFREAFTSEPKLPENVPAGARYIAACAAVLAGCGQGKDADSLDDEQRSLWRRQALQWLRQDLTWWGKALDNSNAQVRDNLRQRMQQWLGEGDLAGIRAPDALARLPVEEREQWGKLWSEVDALLRRASEPR
jgi:serine/threonine-protein kinase